MGIFNVGGLYLFSDDCLVIHVLRYFAINYIISNSPGDIILIMSSSLFVGIVRHTTRYCIFRLRSVFSRSDEVGSISGLGFIGQ